MRANRSRKRHDTVAPAVRRKIMQAVKSSGTDIEETVASLVRELTMPFRRNVAGLPGRPDLCNKTRRWAIFVNGCFWHCHTNCAKTQGGRYGRIPKTNSAFWQQKLLRNRIRDHQSRVLLRRMGYRVLTVWQCQCSNQLQLRRRLNHFFGQLRPHDARGPLGSTQPTRASRSSAGVA